MNKTIILSGSTGVGKSTIGKLLSKKLSIPQSDCVVYTEGKTSDETCYETVDLLGETRN